MLYLVAPILSGCASTCSHCNPASLRLYLPAFCPVLLPSDASYTTSCILAVLLSGQMISLPLVGRCIGLSGSEFMDYYSNEKSLNRPELTPLTSQACAAYLCLCRSYIIHHVSRQSHAWQEHDIAIVLLQATTRHPQGHSNTIGSVMGTYYIR